MNWFRKKTICNEGREGGRRITRYPSENTFEAINAYGKRIDDEKLIIDNTWLRGESLVASIALLSADIVYGIICISVFGHIGN